MTGQKSVSIEKQVIFIGTWKSVKLTDFCLKEIQMQEGRNEGCMCLLQLSLSGLFVFSKDGSFKTGLEKGISLNKIYTIASKRKRPKNLMCLIEEGGNKFTVFVFRCVTTDDSILVQNTLRQLWEMEYCPVVLLSKRGHGNSRKSRSRSALRYRSSSRNETLHQDSEKADPKGGHLFVQKERQKRTSRYGSPPKSSFHRRSKSHDGSQHRVHWRPVALSSIGVQSEPPEMKKFDEDQPNISIDVLKKELKTIFTEIHDIRRFLEKSNSGSSINQGDDEENHYGDVGVLPLLGSDGNEIESNGTHIGGYVTSDDGSSLELVGASELSDADDEYIMARRSLVSKPHSGYFLEKSMRYEPDYLKSDPLYGKLRKNRTNDEHFVDSATNTGGVVDELTASRRHAISMSNTQRRHQESTKNIRDSTESSCSDGINPPLASLKRSRKDEYFYIPYRTKPIGMDYYAGVRTGIRKPLEQALGKKDKFAFRVRSFTSSDPRKKPSSK